MAGIRKRMIERRCHLTVHGSLKRRRCTDRIYRLLSRASGTANSISGGDVGGED
jgi:hypothetical protein